MRPEVINHLILLPVAAAAVWAIIWIIRDGNANDRYKQRMLSGQPICRICGYDLRGNTDRCPECGTLWHRRPPSRSS